MAEKAVAKAVNQIKNRVEVREFLPKGGQNRDGIKNAREHRQRQNEKVLQRCDLVKGLRPQACQNAQNGKKCAACKRKGNSPQRMREWQIHKKRRHKQNGDAD